MIIFLALLSLFYLVFFVWLRNGLNADDGQVSSEDAIDLPSVAVIVAARNEEENIGPLLNHLLQQNYPDDRLEIIIANDNSSDATGSVVERFSQNNPTIQHLFIHDTPTDWSPKMWALSKAVQASTGEILVFTDADCMMGSEWIVAMIASFKNVDIGMVAGPSPLEKKDSRLWNRMLLLDSIGQDAVAAGGFSRGIPLTSSGRNRAIRRSAFDSINGYEELKFFFSGDDDLMMHKLNDAGWRISFCTKPAAEVRSAPPHTFRAFIKQRLRFASKGRTYFDLPFIRNTFKWILLLIFLTNLAVLTGMFMFLITFKSAWLLPWFLKMVGDGILMSRYTSLGARPLHPGVFLLGELWHSLYVVVFGILGSFLPIYWKGRKKNLRIA